MHIEDDNVNVIDPDEWIVSFQNNDDYSYKFNGTITVQIDDVVKYNKTFDVSENIDFVTIYGHD